MERVVNFDFCNRKCPINILSKTLRFLDYGHFVNFQECLFFVLVAQLWKKLCYFKKLKGEIQFNLQRVKKKVIMKSVLQGHAFLKHNQILTD